MIVIIIIPVMGIQDVNHDRRDARCFLHYHFFFTIMVTLQSCNKNYKGHYWILSKCSTGIPVEGKRRV